MKIINVNNFSECITLYLQNSLNDIKFLKFSDTLWQGKWMGYDLL